MDDESETIPPLIISDGLLSVIPETGRLQQTVTCRICYELLQAPVITSCSHTFCSLCIRRYLQYKPQCPACSGTTYEQNLRSNKLAEEIVGHFRSLIAKAEDLVIRKGTTVLQVNKTMKENILPSGESKKEMEAKARSPSKTALKVLPEDNNAVAHEEDENPEVIIPKPTGMLKKTSSEKQLAKAVPSSCSNYPITESKSTCPVCNVEVPTRNLNKHVNFCLSNKDKSPVASRVTRKPLPKLVYALLKDSELRKRCKEVGLNPKGDKRTLTARHQKYTLLYNTECDLDNPRSRMEIVMQVEREEVAEKRGAGSSSTSTKTMLAFDRKTDPGVIEEKQKQYLQQNKSNFQELIEKAKQNRKKQKEVIKDGESSDGVKSDADEVMDIAEESSSSSIFVMETGEVSNPSIVPRQESSPIKFSKLQDKEAEDSIVEQSETISKVRLDSLNTDKAEDTDTKANTSEIERTPRKQCSSSLYLTPKKEKIEKLLKSPNFSQMSIAQSLNQSAKRSEKLKKVDCPGGCGLQVTELYLNIHLDKCLRDAETSPVFESKRNAVKSKVGGKIRGNPVRVIGVMPKTHDISDSSDSETSDVDPQEAKRLLRKRINIKPIIDSDDDEAKEDLPVLDVSPMSPNLLDDANDDEIESETTRKSAAKTSRSCNSREDSFRNRLEETFEMKSKVEDNSDLAKQESTCSYKSKDMFDDDSDFDKSTDVDEPTPPMLENKFVENCNDETHNGDVTGEFMDVDDLDDDIQDLLDAALDVENSERNEAATSPVNWSTPLVSSTAKDHLRNASSAECFPSFVAAKDHFKKVSSSESSPAFVTAKDHLKTASSAESFPSFVTAKDNLKTVSSSESFLTFVTAKDHLRTVSSAESFPAFVTAKDHLRTVSSAESFPGFATPAPLTAAAKFEISQENPTARGRKVKESAAKKTSGDTTEKSESEVERRSLRLRKRK